MRLARPYARHALTILVAIALLLVFSWVTREEIRSGVQIWDSWWWLDGR